MTPANETTASHGPVVTYALMAIMVFVSLAALIWPPLAAVVGGAGTLDYPWQPWTAVFLHGWPGVPVLLHLAGNLALLAFIGPAVEEHLGAGRFLALTVAAIAAAGLLRRFGGPPFNGASAFIWAYAPLLWLLLRRGLVQAKSGVLWLMWVVVPLAMGLLLALNGLDFTTALLLGNAYHISGTAVGFLAAGWWRGR